MSRSARHIPPDEWRASRIEKVNLVFDLLVEGAKTGGQLAEELDVTTSTIIRVVHDLRLILGGDDTIVVVSRPQGQHEPHLYELVGNYQDSVEWRHGRISNLEARLRIDEYSMRAIARGSDKRTVDGKKADKIQRTLKYLREELADLDA